MFFKEIRLNLGDFLFDTVANILVNLLDNSVWVRLVGLFQVKLDPLKDLIELLLLETMPLCEFVNIHAQGCFHSIPSAVR